MLFLDKFDNNSPIVCTDNILSPTTHLRLTASSCIAYLRHIMSILDTYARAYVRDNILP